MKIITLRTDKKNNTFFEVTFPYDKQIIEAIKKIPQRKYDEKKTCWLVPADHAIIRYVDVFSKYFQFKISDDAILLIEKLKTPPTSDIDTPTLKMTLRNFQKLGVSYAKKAERCFIADDMGLGKTCESIATVESLNAYPCLVVCPASVKLNWQKEISMWVDRLSMVVSGEKTDGYKYDTDFVIINYDILEKHEKNLKKIGFKSIILDESHYVKGYKSKRTKSARSIARKIKYRFALTGTPVMNKPQELIPQLDILGRLDSLGGFWTFAKTYCDAKQTQFGWDFSGRSNLDELNKKLNDICFIRRLKSEVLDELPAKQRTMVPIDIDNMKEYKQVKKDFVSWLKGNIMKKDDYASEINRNEKLTESQKKLLIQAKIDRKVARSRAAEAVVKIEYLKQVCARGKVQRFQDFIDNIIEQGNKLVVFAVHKDIQNLLFDKYRSQNAARIFSEDNTTKRQENIDKFQNDDTCKLMVASLAAGGVGITLTAASIVAFVEFGWTSAVHDQAEDRCHRIGQHDSVNCYYFYGENTIDEYILELINEKRQIADNIVDGKSMEMDESDLEKIIRKFV